MAGSFGFQLPEGNIDPARISEFLKRSPAVNPQAGDTDKVGVRQDSATTRSDANVPASIDGFTGEDQGAEDRRLQLAGLLRETAGVDHPESVAEALRDASDQKTFPLRRLPRDEDRDTRDMTRLGMGRQEISILRSRGVL